MSKESASNEKEYTAERVYPHFLLCFSRILFISLYVLFETVLQQSLHISQVLIDTDADTESRITSQYMGVKCKISM